MLKRTVATGQFSKSGIATVIGMSILTYASLAWGVSVNHRFTIKVPLEDCLKIAQDTVTGSGLTNVWRNDGYREVTGIGVNNEFVIGCRSSNKDESLVSIIVYGDNPGSDAAQRYVKDISTRMTTSASALISERASFLAEISTFSDVPSNHWAKTFIAELVKMGIMEPGSADGKTFKPDDPVTRAEFAAMLKQANGEEYWNKPGIRGSVDFDDVKPTYWAGSAIRSAVRTGFMKGYPDGTFQPETKMTREEVFASLAKGLGYPSPKAPESVLSIYKDASSISYNVEAAVAAATIRQLVVNYPNVAQLRPKSNVTRAEVAAAIYQAMVSEEIAPAINSPYIVTPKPAAPSR